MPRRLHIALLLLGLALPGCGNADGVVHFSLYMSSTTAAAMDKLEVEIWSVDQTVLRGEATYQDTEIASWTKAWKIPQGGEHMADWTYISNREERVRALIKAYKLLNTKFIEIIGGVPSGEVRVQPGEVVDVTIDLRLTK